MSFQSNAEIYVSFQGVSTFLNHSGIAQNPSLNDISHGIIFDFDIDAAFGNS
jgi:hypothetical protein